MWLCHHDRPTIKTVAVVMVETSGGWTLLQELYEYTPDCRRWISYRTGTVLKHREYRWARASDVEKILMETMP